METVTVREDISEEAPQTFTATVKPEFADLETSVIITGKKHETKVVLDTWKTEDAPEEAEEVNTIERPEISESNLVEITTIHDTVTESLVPEETKEFVTSSSAEVHESIPVETQPTLSAPQPETPLRPNLIARRLNEIVIGEAMYDTVESSDDTYYDARSEIYTSDTDHFYTPSRGSLSSLTAIHVSGSQDFEDVAELPTTVEEDVAGEMTVETYENQAENASHPEVLLTLRETFSKPPCLNSQNQCRQSNWRARYSQSRWRKQLWKKRSLSLESESEASVQTIVDKLQLMIDQGMLDEIELFTNEEDGESQPESVVNVFSVQDLEGPVGKSELVKTELSDLIQKPTMIVEETTSIQKKSTEEIEDEKYEAMVAEAMKEHFIQHPDQWDSIVASSAQETVIEDIDSIGIAEMKPELHAAFVMPTVKHGEDVRLKDYTNELLEEQRDNAAPVEEVDISVTVTSTPLEETQLSVVTKVEAVRRPLRRLQSNQ